MKILQNDDSCWKLDRTYTVRQTSIIFRFLIASVWKEATMKAEFEMFKKYKLHVKTWKDTIVGAGT